MRQVTLTIPNEFYAPLMNVERALSFSNKSEKVPAALKSKVSKAAKQKPSA